MSNEFSTLRAIARKRRDKTIAEARREYEATIVRIVALEQDLLGKAPARHKPLSLAVESVIPRDKPFTVPDIVARLKALDAGRVWRSHSVATHLGKLRARGLLRRVRRGVVATYVRAGAPVEPQPFEGMTLAEVVREVLAARQPLRTMELVVAMLEAGFQTGRESKRLRFEVEKLLRIGHYRMTGDRSGVGGVSNPTCRPLRRRLRYAQTNLLRQRQQDDHSRCLRP